MSDWIDSMINPYELLGLREDATPKEIKKAYYHLAQMVHPDHGGCADDMIAVQKAYQAVMKLQTEDTRVTCPNMQSIREDVLNVDREKIKALIMAQSITISRDIDFVAQLIAYEYSYKFIDCQDPEDIALFVSDYLQRFQQSLRETMPTETVEYSASMVGGYGNLLDEDMIEEEENEADRPGALIVYETPFGATSLPVSTIENVKRVKDFTESDMYDIKQAFQSKANTLDTDILPPALGLSELEAEMERMRLEREEVDQLLAAGAKKTKLSMRWAYRLDE